MEFSELRMKEIALNRVKMISQWNITIYKIEKICISQIFSNLKLEYITNVSDTGKSWVLMDSEQANSWGNIAKEFDLGFPI